MTVGISKMVGLVRFELTTSCTPCKRATRLRYSPMIHRKDEEAPRVPARQVIIFRPAPHGKKSAAVACWGMATTRTARRPQRQRYRNREGESPIEAFEIARGAVRIWFRGDAVPYRYTTRVTELARRARAGRGLATFISQHRAELPFERG